jgi:hypothetical protein
LWAYFPWVASFGATALVLFQDFSPVEEILNFPSLFWSPVTPVPFGLACNVKHLLMGQAPLLAVGATRVIS